MINTPLARRTLRAVHALHCAGESTSFRSLVAIVPAPPVAIAEMVRALDAEGYLDADRMRLTLRGFAAAVAPIAVAYERRRNLRLRKAGRVA